MTDRAVYITISEWTGRHETYSSFFTCPNCNENEIKSDFKFCPMCGLQIVFKDGIDKEIQTKDDESMGI